MYAVLVVVVVDGMVFIGVVEACRWVVIVVVLGGWIGVCLGIGLVVVVGEGRCVGGEEGEGEVWSHGRERQRELFIMGHKVVWCLDFFLFLFASRKTKVSDREFDSRGRHSACETVIAVHMVK